MSSEPCIHLNVHSTYSLLEGAIKVKDLMDRCEKEGMSAVAVTDSGTMYGVIDFYLAAKKKGIKPIIGCDMYLAQDMTKRERGFSRLVLLAKDYDGYQSLINLVTKAHLDGFYYKPRIDLDCLAEHRNGLIAISPGNRGPIGIPIRDYKEAEAEQTALALKEIFGSDFYMGIQKLDMPMEDIVNDTTCSIGQKHDIPVVACQEVYYDKEEDAFLKNILQCIQMGKRLDDNQRVKFQGSEMYFRSHQQMESLFENFPEALANTNRIAAQCNLEIETEQVKLPHFECPDKLSPEDYLKKLVWDGMTRKYGEINEPLRDRVEFELEIINKMHYAPYFLIIYDFLDFARRESIPIGPGRGSAAGSIVAYALDITNIDPIRYNLLFERFLNPERVSMPDIDLDFCIRRRGEIIDYIVKTYGEDRVSQIITFGTMAARGVVRDVGRTLDVPLNIVDKIAKLIPSSPGQYTSIPDALEQVAELKQIYREADEYKQLLDVGAQLEGQARHTSTHAAGVVISRDPLSTVVPLTTNEGQVVTQFQMTDIEKVGLLKMDILGLRNLTVVQDTQRLIKLHRGIDLDVESLPIDDEKTYDLLCSGLTTGVFQLESRGMRALIKDLKPRVFEDIIALLALYRPGPLGSGMVGEFISNKSGETTVKYDLPQLEPILKETYGMILYQEQVMQIASVVGGFSLGQADMLRRAMGKKKKDVMDEMREQFLDGAKAQNLPLEKAKHIFELCYKFAEYGFNKSHSAAYALISYQTAYLKANYPVEYMAALLTSIQSLTDKIALYVQECQVLGIPVLGPNVNESEIDFSICKVKQSKGPDQDGIRFGLGAIKNVGDGAILSILENRKKPYKNLLDLCKQVDLKQVNKRVVESLVRAGAIDTIGDRSELLMTYERILEAAQSIAKERSNGQTSMFPGMETDLAASFSPTLSNERQYISEYEKLRMEKDMLGLYISGHPLDQISDKIKALPNQCETLNKDQEGQSVTVGGLLSDCRKILTRNGREMMLGTLEDFRSQVTLMLFQDTRTEHLVEKFKNENVVVVKGKVRVNNDEISLIVEDIQTIEGLHQEKIITVDIATIDDTRVFEKIKEISLKFKGSMPLQFKMGTTTIETHPKYWVPEDDLCLKQIENIVGAGQLWITSR